MKESLSTLLKQFCDKELEDANVIPWASPVPVFGNIKSSKIGTLGLNPSNREFVDTKGEELSGFERRFHTLNSLGLKSWKNAKKSHLEKIMLTYEQYFKGNPYSQWFQELDVIINSLGSSYYGNNRIDACHLDLIPFATSCKWTELSESQRKYLLDVSENAFARILKGSSVTLLVLNGKSVIRHLEEHSDVQFETKEMPEWILKRKDSDGVKGFSYQGYVTKIGDIQLERDILVIGFNHNLQSSFGVTKKVKSSIREWVGTTAKEHIA